MISLIYSLIITIKEGNLNMAKNLIEQFLDFATSKLTGPLGDDIYIKEESEVNTGMTGVARYLAKQEQAAQAAAAMTGVAKYLARQAQAVAKPAAAPTAEAETAAPESQAPMSRVEKYLASQAVAKPAAPAQEAAAPLSRVAKYLASQAAAAKPAVTEAAAAPVAQEPSAPISRVEKYLASQAAAKPAAAAAAEPAAPAQEAAPPLSRVAKYLASQQAASAAEPAAASDESVEQESSAPLSRVAKYLAAVGKEFKPDVANKSETVAQLQEEPAKRTGVSKYLASHNKAVAESSGIGTVAQVIKDFGKVEAPSEEIEISEDEAVSESGNIIRLDDGKQCQASTAKGTQCKNKSNLGHIQLAVNDQEYRFSVCTQHNNENFKPFAELLDA
jgi:hypothetical protein